MFNQDLHNASNCPEVYRACCVEELPNIAVGLPEVARLMCSLFVHCNLDVLFLWGVSAMFLEGNEPRGRRLVEEAMEARNPKTTYLFSMLELLTSPHLESAKVDWVLGFLESLKENEDMV